MVDLCNRRVATGIGYLTASLRCKQSSRKMLVELREVTCNWDPCSRVFCLCARHDHNRKYCSDECRSLSRDLIVDQARDKYAKSEDGILNNRARQQRHRDRQKEQEAQFEPDFVTDLSSQQQKDAYSWAHEAVEKHIKRRVTYRLSPQQDEVCVPEMPCCLICGRPGVIVYGHRSRGRFRQEEV
jgi:hypothetical protein